MKFRPWNEEIATEYSQKIYQEFYDASSNFPAFASDHEGYAIILEEMDELWEAVKLNQKDPERDKKMEKDVTQVGAMALRFLHDLRLRREGC